MLFLAHEGEITVRGVTYANADEAAAVLGVGRHRILAAQRKGKLETVGLKRRYRDFEINGKRFADLNAAAKHFGVTTDRIEQAVRSGKTETLGTRMRPCEMKISIRGQVYANAKEAAEAFGVKQSAVYQAIYRGTIDRLGLGAASPLDGSRIMLHPALIASATDLIFVRPQSTGFWRFVTFNFDGSRTTQTPTGSFAEVFADQALEYLVASPDEDGPAPSGTHGIQLKDPSGKVTFDSRYPQVAIVHTVVVPKSILEEILLSTRSSYDITLPKPVPNCWVSCPYHCSFAQTSGGTNFVKVHQLNNTTIRLSKQGNGTGTTYAKFFTQDLILFFARTA